jgi:hypothetical protein
MGDFIDQVFVRAGVHYSLRLTLRPAAAFSLLLINDDIPERWEATFSSAYVGDLTTKAGFVKTYSLFTQMLQLAITNASDELSFDVIAPADVGIDPTSEDPDERRYLVLTQTTQFDSVSYPLPLIRRPFSPGELKLIIRQYRQDNLALRAELEHFRSSRASSTILYDRARTPNPTRPPPFLTPNPKRTKRS